MADKIFFSLLFAAWGVFAVLKPKVLLDMRSGVQKRNKYTDELEFNKWDIIWVRIAGTIIITGVIVYWI